MSFKYCSSCGREVRNQTFKFCPECGSVLIDRQPDPQEAPTGSAGEETAAALDSTMQRSRSIALRLPRFRRMLPVLAAMLLGVSIGINIYLWWAEGIQDTRLRQLSADRTKLQEQVQQQGESSHRTEDELQKVVGENKQLQKRVQELTGENNRLQGEIQNLRIAYDTLKKMYDSMETTGQPYLGVAVRDNLLGPPGARIVRVAPRSPAALVKEGAKQGLESEEASYYGEIDVITGIDGYRIGGISDFHARLSMYRPGDTIRLTVATMASKSSDRVRGYEDVYVVVLARKP